MEPGLVVVPVRLGMQHAVRFDEDDPLLRGVLDPQDEVGIEAALVEESDALSPAQIPQQKDLLAGKRTIPLRQAVPPQILHEPAFRFVEARRVAPYLVAALKQQRLIQMTVEVDRRQLVRIRAIDVVGLGDELPDRVDQLGLAARDPDRIVPEIRVVLIELRIDHVLRLPTLPVEAVEPVHVAPQDGEHRLVERLGPGEGPRNHGRIVRDQAVETVGIGSLDDRPSGLGPNDQVGVLPALLVFKKLQVDPLPIDQIEAGGRYRHVTAAAYRRRLQAAGAAFQRLHLERQVDARPDLWIRLQQEVRLLGEVPVRRHARHHQSLAQEGFVGPDAERQLDFAVDFEAFLFQVGAELGHVVGAHGEHVERLQHAETGGMIAFQRRASLQAVSPAPQANAAPEELDDLRSLPAADVEQSHARHPPRVPALHELLRADEHVDGRGRAADGVEQRSAHGVFFQHDPGVIGLGEFSESGGVADVDESEVVGGAAGLQPDLAGAAPDRAQMQAAPGRRVQHRGQQVAVQRRGGTALAQRLETAAERVLSVRRDQPRPAFEQRRDRLHRPVLPVLQHAVQKADDGQHVAPLPAGLRIHRVHGAADEDPQRALQVVRAQGVGPFPEHPLLFVERQQVAQQQRVGPLLGGLLPQIQHPKILAVAVAVEVAVGVVEDDRLAVLRGELVVPRRGQRLPEGGAVFEGEPGFAQRVAEAPPGGAAGAFVSLVHEDQVVALERLHRHAHAAAALLLHQLGDLDHRDLILGRGHEAARVHVEAPAADVGGGQLRHVLLAQPLVRRDQQHVVERLPVVV